MRTFLKKESPSTIYFSAKSACRSGELHAYVEFQRAVPYSIYATSSYSNHA